MEVNFMVLSRDQAPDLRRGTATIICVQECVCVCVCLCAGVVAVFEHGNNFISQWCKTKTEKKVKLCSFQNLCKYLKLYDCLIKPMV